MNTAKEITVSLVQRLSPRRPRALWHRYVLGFLIIFATVSASHWVSLKTITAAENDAEVLSVSSRQRMLSQRILFLMSEAEQSTEPDVAHRLDAALNLFETSHNWLSVRPELSPELRALYFEDGPIPLDAFSRRFVQMAGIASSAQGAEKEELRKLLANWGTHDLLASLATAANLFRFQSEARIARLQAIQKYTLMAALLVLLLEALLIFLPAQLSVNQAIDRLEARKKQLKKSLSKLKKQNNELTNARESLAHAANHDALTRLSNRRAIYEHLNIEKTSSPKAAVPGCVMKIDLDLFKEVNDTYGHDAGDRLLVHVANILRAKTRKQDIVGRIGGDEFVIILNDPPSLEMIEVLAHRIIEAVAQPVTLDHAQCRIGASIGYTLASSSEGTADQILIEADLALYEAKRAGRGQAFAYSDVLATEIETRRQLFKDINEALTEDQFEVYVQPQVYTKTGAVYGCEILARWRHPARGIVSPAHFIAAAEEAQLVDQIDRMALEKGLDFLERVLADGLDLPGISINASPPTLRDIHLTDRLLQEVHARHLSPAHLTVEVLESTLIESDDDVALQTIESLSRAGFKVVLDDFGTGYASMSNLSRLKLDGIKLDQSLVKPVPEPRADSIIAALVALSRSLNMSVVAEGVETSKHYASVAKLGCDVVQGYIVAKPMPADEFIQWFNDYSCAQSARA